MDHISIPPHARKGFASTRLARARSCEENGEAATQAQRAGGGAVALEKVKGNLKVEGLK
jgi:hypothetical protein